MPESNPSVSGRSTISCPAACEVPAMLLADIARLRAALAFYAHPEHIEEDRGALAQDALGPRWMTEWEALPIDDWGDQDA